MQPRGCFGVAGPDPKHKALQVDGRTRAWHRQPGPERSCAGWERGRPRRNGAAPQWLLKNSEKDVWRRWSFAAAPAKSPALALHLAMAEATTTLGRSLEDSESRAGACGREARRAAETGPGGCWERRAESSRSAWGTSPDPPAAEDAPPLLSWPLGSPGMATGPVRA